MTTEAPHWAEQVSILRAQVAHLLGIRLIDAGIQDMIRNNPPIGAPSEFWAVYHDLYSTAITTGIRRIIFPSGSAVCLVRLLRNIAKSTARPAEIELAGIEADLKELDALGASIKRHVDEYIAHISQAPTGPHVRWKDLPSALERCAAITLKYSKALTKDPIVDLTPVIADDWRVIFRIPWIREKAGA